MSPVIISSLIPLMQSCIERLAALRTALLSPPALSDGISSRMKNSVLQRLKNSVTLVSRVRSKPEFIIHMFRADAILKWDVAFERLILNTPGNMYNCITFNDLLTIGTLILTWHVRSLDAILKALNKSIPVSNSHLVIGYFSWVIISHNFVF